MSSSRESLSSSLGFLLVSAGCAVGLGNVWRFPYVVGENGGALFLIVYIICLLLIGFPLMTMEFAIGRAAKHSVVKAYDALNPKPGIFRAIRLFQMAANWALLMFYTTVAGWMLAYTQKSLTSQVLFSHSTDLANLFNEFLSSPLSQVFWMTATIVIGFIICLVGLRNGVERSTKWMMGLLFIILIGLAIYCLQLPGAEKGLAFYLKPDWAILHNHQQLGSLSLATMAQAFFTLSIGIGSMMIFGSYTSRRHRLSGEVLKIVLIDLLIAFTSGLIIFTACGAFNITPNAGPELIFITLPRVFAEMQLGRLVGATFFVLLSLAAITTIIAVMENLVAMLMEWLTLSRRKAVCITAPILWLLSLPCALSGYLGLGSTILTWEDFFVSTLALPLGGGAILIFCTHKRFWGWDHCMAEVNTGDGLLFPSWLKHYVRWILPLLVLFIFAIQLIDFFA